MNSKMCANCSEVLTRKNQRKFCSQSCSAIYNNKIRVVTLAQKFKTAESMKGMCLNDKERLRIEQRHVGKIPETERSTRGKIWNYTTSPKLLLTGKWSELNPTLKRKRVAMQQEGKCFKCGRKEWNGKPILLEFHHVDGDHSNTSRQNLQFLCRNCHSQTENYLNRKNTSSSAYSEECSGCNTLYWHGDKLVKECNHKNGNRSDNSSSNLEFLCPNCHAQTQTFRKPHGRVTDEMHINSYKRIKNLCPHITVRKNYNN